MNVLALSGESDFHSRGAGGQSYAETVNANPTSSSSRSSPRMEVHETNNAGEFVVAPAAAAGESAVLTLEELLDGPASCRGSTTEAPAHLPVTKFLTTQHNDSDDKQREAPAAGPAYAEKAAAAAASTEYSRETTATAALPAAANLAPLSSPSREALSSARASSSPLRDSVAATSAHLSALLADAGSSGVSLSVLTTAPTDPLVAGAAESAASQWHEETTPSHVKDSTAVGLQAAAAGSVAEKSPIAKRPATKAEESPRALTRAASLSAARVARQGVGHGHNSSAATPSKRVSKGRSATPGCAAALLRGILGTATPADRAAADARKNRAVSTAPPPISTLDLPVGLLLLYCAAEETCTALEGGATSSTASALAHSLLYILEQISDLRRRDHRQAALKQASELERAKCEELYEAAEKKRALAAAQRTAHAQAVEQEELGACTFRPAVSKMARRMEAKGVKNFMEKCMMWKAEADRRLRQRCDHLAEVEAEQRAAAAAQSGMLTPGKAVTKGSRRLLAQPSVQERLKSRPRLWEVKRPSEGPQEGGVHVLVPAHVLADTATSSPRLVGAPITSSTAEEQEAVLRELRRPGTEAGASDDLPLQLPQNTSTSRVSKNSEGTVKGFLSRVEQDAERREQTVAKLQARYHNPDAELFEGGTGRPFFCPNAMPMVWKDGHRVSYDDLPKEKQRDFRAELRRAGLDFVLAHYLRERQREKRQNVTGSGRGSSVAAQGDGADVGEGSTAPRHSISSQSHGHALTVARQARFMASLEAALARKQKSWERLRAQATAEETFHPKITKRSERMALHKTGGTPIYERPTELRRGSSAEGARSEKSQGQPSSAVHKDRPLPEVAQVFLDRSGKWMESRQRRLQHLAEMEEERRRAECTFTPNRYFGDACEKTEVSRGMEVSRTGASSDTDALVGPDAAGGDAEGCRDTSQSRVLLQDLMASAADVRVINELELLRTGAAYRDARFVQAVCDQSGLTDARRAMANLSLQSAPRLTRSRKDAWEASRPPHQSSATLFQSPLSPIPQRSNRPSASPYTLPRRDTTSFSSFHESAPKSVPTLSQGESAQTPMPRSVARDATAARSGVRDFTLSVPPVEDPWAALDAQTDAILKRYGR
ncbi:conserved hypothetical protein [Leishmania major strain Friedlin]|uniref:Uncharacterized protein n=1 Tax=Leishmania major TaxID=5664 RepID=Q4Q4Z2_LEIMA|nr:conserved hypothetical protein [Leishmania major strain Friedlin]CAG9580421.1 hypothetical_protein_-_conserved [Leishmania major strain Friedlin]CAJ08810.1 conserved hypothetical protein [Leishmania major strain Friedlin]|eukprot:XP_001685606.1 conserved hypothetical protein [Leishmania major strain Friedlin]